MRTLYRQLQERLDDVGKLVGMGNYPSAQKTLERVKTCLQQYTGDDGELQKRIGDYTEAIKSNAQYTRLNALIITAKRAAERNDYVDLSDALVRVKKELDQLPQDKHPAAHKDYAAFAHQLEPHNEYVDLFKITRKTVENAEKDLATLVAQDAAQKPVDAAKLTQLAKRLQTADNSLDLVPAETTPKCAELKSKLESIRAGYETLHKKYSAKN
jgi:chromosome segregation ATPase